MSDDKELFPFATLHLLSLEEAVAGQRVATFRLEIVGHVDQVFRCAVGDWVTLNGRVTLTA